MPDVALVSGFWSQNIGNAYFNVGGKYILEQVLGAEGVRFIQDQPAYCTFHKQSTGNPRNDISLLKYLDVDYVVLQGPMLTKNFRHIWGDAFAEYKKRNIRVILLGAAFFKFSDEEVNAALDFLKEYPPAIITTRDHATYERIQNAAPFTYDGIDSAFFVPDAYKPFKLSIDPYVTLNFDRFPEPTITLDRQPGANDLANGFSWGGHRWDLKIPKLQNWCSHQGKWQAYIGAKLDCRRLPSEIADYRVIRPEHRFNPHVAWKIYKQPNAIASDEPFTYFTVYANTSLTLADRVHACVATLAYGNPAMLFTPSPRSRLFDRLDLSDIRLKPVELAPERLREEKGQLLDFMKKAISQIG